MTREELLKIAKPILFNTDMVRAILEDRKNVTRRCLKGYALDNLEVDTDETIIGVYNRAEGRVDSILTYARYKPGDYLYVRETWMVQAAKRYDAIARIYYRAGEPMTTIYFPNGCTDSINRVGYDAFISKWRLNRWYPSIHMPKEAARIFLKVTDVRVERLQEITDEEAEREGCNDYTSTANGFSYVWNSTVPKKERDKYGWRANPWVWVIQFERIEIEE